MASCPLCEKELEEDDRLVLEYSVEYGWWALFHYKNVVTDYVGEEGRQMVHRRAWCGQAMFHLKGVESIFA